MLILQLKIWIIMLIPRIEDGNNFGVSIQEDTLSEIRTVESEAAAYFDQVSRYYLSRGKIVAKIAKYPHVVSNSKRQKSIDRLTPFIVATSGGLPTNT